MVFLNPELLNAARVVVRQAADTALSTVTSVAAPTSEIASPTALVSSAVNAPTSTVFSSTAPTASETGTNTLLNGGANPGGGNENGGNGGGGGGGNSSSLLFFVALGFGVVFTNLWIIVGVKYCFRYNARNRALRNEEGDPINMENMPRPHRRRREKKLMPIDEVNEKFPMLKYKTWVASRAQEGLPTRGGVSAPASRPNSIRDADGVVPELPPKERMSTDERPTTSATAAKAAAAADTAPDAATAMPEKSQDQGPRHVPKESTSSTVAGLRRASTESRREPDNTVADKHMSQISHDEDDDDDHIDAALPPECLGTSGDTCAICIDTLEDDDDVRGLTCGHAFHAVCIDPWLTTRRACCPLCKADYYTPKPRPPAPEGGDAAAGAPPLTLREMHLTSPRVRRHVRPPFFSMGGPRRTNHTGRHPAGVARTREDGASSVPGRQRIRAAFSPASAPASAPAAGTPNSGGMLSGLRNAYLGFRVGRRRNNDAESDPVASGANPAATTPSQLEAGVRNPQT